MNEHQDVPIFCDNCPELALALLDGAPLCDRCLKRVVLNDSSLGSMEKIEPLRFSSSGQPLRALPGGTADAA